MSVEIQGPQLNQINTKEIIIGSKCSYCGRTYTLASVPVGQAPGWHEHPNGGFTCPGWQSHSIPVRQIVS